MLELIDAEGVLDTARLRLEPLRPDHAPLLFAALCDERLYTYIPADPPPDLAALVERYGRLATRRSPEGDQLWLNWAVRRTRDDASIGVVQATVCAERRAYLAYMLGSAFWGQGYAREACRRVLSLLFGAYQVERVVAEVDTRNQASWSLLERLGFRRTAYRPAADHFKGSSSDEYTYELNEQHWQEHSPAR